jgi:hypothetical protein
MGNKDWKGNKTSTITTSGFHNLSKHNRDSVDFYATDPIALEKLLQYEQFSNVWECACGNGHLAEVLKKHNILGKSSDLYIRDYPCEQIDFLKFNDKWNGDIITNPPYKWATQFVYKALEIVNEGNKIAMIFPQRYLSSKSRYKLFTEYPPKVVYAFSGRISCALNGNFNSHSNSAVDYMWIVWYKGYKDYTILKWIL